MHPALQITEILDKIFDDPVLCGVSYSTSPDMSILRRRSHLSLALTCRAFTEPALRVLWREIDGIDPLLRTMGKGVIKIAGPTSKPTPGQFGPPIPGLDDILYSEDDDGLFWDSEWDQLSEDDIGQTRTFGFSRRSKRKQKPIRSYIIFTKEPIGQDWEPFDRYAHYVQAFGCTKSPDGLKLARNVYSALQAHCSKKGAPLLPNLRFLACTGRQLRYASLLLTPAIHTLHISYSSQNKGAAFHNDFTSFIEAVMRNPPPAIKSIELPPFAPQHFLDLIPEMVISCHRRGLGLEKLCSLDTLLTPETLRIILTTKHVKVVEVMVKELDLDSVFGKYAPSGRDSDGDIRVFRVHSEQAAESAREKRWLKNSFYEELIQRLKSPKLRYLEVDGAAYCPRPRDLNGLFSLLRHGGGFAVKDDVHVPNPSIIIAPERGCGRASKSVEDYVCTFANTFYLLCQPAPSSPSMLPFSSLCQLRLEGALVDLTDDELGTVSASLPRLTEFTVESALEGRIGKSKTTLVGLWLVAKNCRDLRFLDLRINAIFEWDNFAAVTRIDVPQDADRKQTLLGEGRSEHMDILMVGSSTIDNSSVAVNFISTVFPNLSHIGYANTREPGREEEIWKDVQDKLREGV